MYNGPFVYANLASKPCHSPALVQCKHFKSPAHRDLATHAHCWPGAGCGGRKIVPDSRSVLARDKPSTWHLLEANQFPLSRVKQLICKQWAAGRFHKHVSPDGSLMATAVRLSPKRSHLLPLLQEITWQQDVI